jgi:hypothetical protein
VPPLCCRERVRPALIKTDIGRTARGHVCSCSWVQRRRQRQRQRQRQRLAHRAETGLIAGHVSLPRVHAHGGGRVLFTAPGRLTTIGGSAGPIRGKWSYHQKQNESIVPCLGACLLASPDGAWPCDRKRSITSEGMGAHCLVVEIPCAAHDRQHGAWGYSACSASGSHGGTSRRWHATKGQSFCRLATTMVLTITYDNSGRPPCGDDHLDSYAARLAGGSCC